MDNVAVNANYKSEGPSWGPDSRRAGCFSHAPRQEKYDPLLAVEAATGQATVVAYPPRCTNPNDLAVNPATEVPESAFAAQDGATQDLFVLFLNPY